MVDAVFSILIALERKRERKIMGELSSQLEVEGSMIFLAWEDVGVSVF